MTEQALLAAILDAPEDDAPRLIYSDWLDEQGRGERAEFIRVQCRLAGLMQHKPSGTSVAVGRSPQIEWREEVEALRRRERELLELADDSWWGDDIQWDFLQPILRRGFVHSITLTAEDWLTHGDAILTAQPVEEVTLTTWPRELTDDYLWPEDASQPSVDYDSEESLRAEMSRRWPRIKKWTLPPQYDVGPLVDAAMETDFIRRCLLTRDQGRSSRSGRLSVPQVLPLVQEYYQMEGNGAGGSLHVVLDDHNYDSVEWCRDWAEEHDDLAGMALAGVLAEMTATQVGELATHPQKRGRTAAEDVPAGRFIQFDVQGRVRRSRP